MERKSAAMILAVLIAVMSLTACGSKTSKQTYNVIQDSKRADALKIKENRRLRN